MNSVLPKLKARFMTADVNNFYLNTHIYIQGYMIIAVNMIPEELIEQYQGDIFVENG